MSTTDPSITIAGQRAQIDELTEQRDRLLRDGTKVMGDLCEVREWHRRDTAERDALATALATRTAERDEALSALAAQSDVIANAATKHGEELARVERERDSALANLRACEARVAAVEAASNKATVEAAALRARVADLEARPVLTVERFTEAYIKAKHGDRAWPDGEASRQGLMASFRAAFAALGAVTLPAQDRAEELNRAYELSRLAYGAGVEAMRVALAKVGAAPTTPPAEVFAGVSVEELARTFDVATSESYIKNGSSIAARASAIRAVLARLKVKLVAPVDPLTIARMTISGSSGDPTVRQVERCRAALIAAGIPVTPERGQ